MRAKSGAMAENLVADLLLKRGWKIEARNFRCRSGELDIVASRGGKYILVEVKYREGLERERWDEVLPFVKVRRLYGAMAVWSARRGVDLELFHGIYLALVIGPWQLPKVVVKWVKLEV